MNGEDKLSKRISTLSGGKEPTHCPKQPLWLSSSGGAAMIYVERDIPGLGRSYRIGLLGARLPTFTGTRGESTFTARVTGKGKWTRLRLLPKGQEARVLIYETASRVRVVSRDFFVARLLGEVSAKTGLFLLPRKKRK